MTPYHSALHRCGERYRDMLLLHHEPQDPLWKFTVEFMLGCRDGLPVPKLCRWLGYIQGVLIERGYTTVTAERDWTRPLFAPLDFPAPAPEEVQKPRAYIAHDNEGEDALGDYLTFSKPTRYPYTPLYALALAPAPEGE